MPTFITEEELSKHFTSVEETAQSAGAPPEPNQNPFFRGTISPVLQHDSNLVATQYKRSSGIPVRPLMPANSGSGAQANAGSTGVASNLIRPIQVQASQNAAAIAALQQTTFQGAWSATTSYSAGAQVDFGGSIYTSLQNSNLNNQPSTSPSFWQTTGGTSSFIGDWNSSAVYQIGNQVIDVAGGGGYYIALVANTNKQPSANPSDWQLITAGNLNSYAGNWSNATAYTVGQTVSYQGSLWVAVAGSTNQTPSTTSSYWTLLGSNALFTGAWSSTTTYTANMVVAYQGNLYQAVQASTNQTPSPSSSTYWQITGPATLDNLADGADFIRVLSYGSINLVPDSDMRVPSTYWYFPNGGGLLGTANQFGPGNNSWALFVGGSPLSVPQFYNLMNIGYGAGQNGPPAADMFLYAGTTYTFSVWAAFPAGATGSLSVGLRNQGGADYQNIIFNPGDSTRKSITFTVGASNVNVVVSAYIVNSASGGTLPANSAIRIAAPQVVVGSNAGAYSSSYFDLNTNLDKMPDGTIYLRGIQYQATTVVIPNGNFEASTSLPVPGWTANATLSYDTATPQSGNQSLKVSTTAQYGAAISLQKWAVTPGQNYFVSGYVKSDGTGIPRVNWQFYDKTGAVVGNVVAAGTTSTSWQFVSNSGTVPANSVYALMILDNFATSQPSAVEFDQVSVVRLTTLGSEVQDGPANFSATASTLTYRPTTNPLTATDAGSNATVNIAAFTMRTSSKGDISVNSGSITGLSYGLLYFVYNDDPTLAGGGVSYSASLTKADALNGVGRFYVGSIVTPLATAPNTTGNNDGGAGAQLGQLLIFLGTSATFSGTGTVTSPFNAIDGNFVNAATVATVTSAGPVTQTENLVLSGFQPMIVPTGTAILNVLSSVDSMQGTGGLATLSYSLNGGSTFTNIYSISSTRAETTDQVTLPSYQNLSTVQVKVTMTSGSVSLNRTNGRIFEAWISVVQ
jgi:hypothetical protein